MFDAIIYGGAAGLIEVLQTATICLIIFAVIPAILATVFSILAYRNSKRSRTNTEKILKELQKKEKSD